MSYTRSGDRPRVMIPTELAQATAKAKTALWAYIGIARWADNETGRASCTVAQIAEAVGLGKSQISVGVGWLLDHGWVTRLVEGRKGSGASLYVVHMEPKRAAEQVAEGGETQRPTFRVLSLTQAPGFRMLRRSASGFPGPDTVSASGNPEVSIRKPGHFLVSSLVSKNSSLDEVEAEDAGTGDETSIPGLLVDVSKPKTSKPKTPTKVDYSPAFEAFWSAYPKRNGQRVGKKAAGREWAKALKSTTADRLMAAVAKYAATCNGYPKDAERFLREEIWADLVPDNATPADMSDEEIEEILGRDLRPLPAPPDHAQPGSAAYAAWKTQIIADRQAERRAQALARKTSKTSTAPRQDNVRSFAS